MGGTSSVSCDLSRCFTASDDGWKVVWSFGNHAWEGSERPSRSSIGYCRVGKEWDQRVEKEIKQGDIEQRKGLNGEKERASG